jgi:dTDP-4-amino-4,6-dideoxygalactose transaminase
MHARNIGTGVHYVGVHLHPWYRDNLHTRAEDYPNATWISERTVSIPLSPHLDDDDVADVIAAVRESLGA